MPESYPKFEDLPTNKSGPHGNAWGLWGTNDQIGTLNHLTDDVVSRAAKEEIKTGKRVSLNWSLKGPSYPRFPRKILDVKLINKAPLKHAHDDEWSFNSQCSSQWDGFRHYAYQKEGLYYLGHTAADFAGSSESNSIHHLSVKGIASRAVFIDWYAWAQRRGLTVDAMSNHPVQWTELIQVLEDQGMSLNEIRPGDILVIRFGYLTQYEGMEEAKRHRLNEQYKTQKPQNIGIQPSRQFLKFLWNTKIAAVAGDSRSFEVWPCQELDWHLHEWLLAGWGMPIGELFDLEALSKMCSSLGRYTFFLSSSPMNAPGAVASPPNALAFF
ncbi:uncharacterized protein F4822DRAFT_423579 [Hypoxylon trugodes]|uniref:uncharacterized protein n=1 Tax=Hypoxylon trugodes TaxID=326681 RepID=UPI002198B118|nr:uncharacterized protein F4822DRAFT_423579 [Hypoxylon trugodes]KAI1393115.1 hypothetical protein F4822DRAFT_423579 [Hypoxylon trugodes]